MWHHTFRAAVVAAVVAVLAFAPIARHTAAAAALVGPKAYYLALGDSLAYGFQPNLNNSAGYPADFFTDLQTHGATMLADMGCSGETTVTFINGGCPYAKLLPPHYTYSGAQLQAALAFLRDPRYAGQVSPVTIDIGANDFLGGAVNTTTCQVTGNLTATLQTIATNLRSILSQLRAALTDTSGHQTGDLITMTYYFPYQNLCPNLMPTVQYFDTLFAAVARQQGALVAPVLAAFGGPATPNQYLCILTWMCQINTYLTCKLAAQACIHPTTLGYAVMAKAIEQTVGY